MKATALLLASLMILPMPIQFSWVFQAPTTTTTQPSYPGGIASFTVVTDTRALVTVCPLTSYGYRFSCQNQYSSPVSPATFNVFGLMRWSACGNSGFAFISHPVTIHLTCQNSPAAPWFRMGVPLFG